MADSIASGSGITGGHVVEAAGVQHALPRTRRHWNRRLIAGAAIILLATGTALGAPWISPYPQEYQELVNRLQGPTTSHWLGTDNFGRDILSRVIWGGRVSLAVGLLSMTIAISVGVVVGATSGYFGRMVDAVLMRFTELMLVFPAFFLLILVIASFGRSVTILVLMLGFTSWAVSARIIRGEVLKVKGRDYILAAQSIGSSNTRVIVRHILPNIASVIIVAATIRVGVLILVEAGLSFLGLGIQEPMSSWGSMIAGGTAYMRQAWWFVAAPGVAIFMTVLGFNLMGEGVRDLLDPRQGRGRAI